MAEMTTEEIHDWVENTLLHNVLELLREEKAFYEEIAACRREKSSERWNAFAKTHFPGFKPDVATDWTQVTVMGYMGRFLGEIYRTDTPAGDKVVMAVGSWEQANRVIQLHNRDKVSDNEPESKVKELEIPENVLEFYQEYQAQFVEENPPEGEDGIEDAEVIEEISPEENLGT